MLIDDGRLPSIHCLLVGEGPDKEKLAGLIGELGLEAHVSLWCAPCLALALPLPMPRLALP